MRLFTGKARKDAKPSSPGSKHRLEEGNSGSAGLGQQGRANSGSAGLEQQGRGNKQCRLGPTEQLRVVVRQILAGSLTADMLFNQSTNPINVHLLSLGLIMGDNRQCLKSRFAMQILHVREFFIIRCKVF
jgi:hypothetical protein